MLLARSLSVLFSIFSINCVIVNSLLSVGDNFRECLISQPASTLGHCLGVGAITKLQSLDNNPEFDIVDGVTLTKDAQEYREAYNFADRDPSNLRWSHNYSYKGIESFKSLQSYAAYLEEEALKRELGGIVDSFSHVLAQRSMRWDMGYLYPGLAMHVAPSASPGGTLEFILDPHREALNVHSLKEASTGRLLARQFLVPFLLGFKFNIATLIPILFGILALLAKKAVLISKFALILSSAFGLGALLFGNGNGNNIHQQQYQGSHFNPGFGGNVYKYPEDQYQDAYYRRVTAHGNDQLRLYGNIPEAFDRTEKEDQTKGRNFAWSEDEKIKAEKP